MKKLLSTILISLGVLVPTLVGAQVFTQRQLIITPFNGVVMSSTTSNSGLLQASTSPTVSSITTTSSSLTNYFGGPVRIATTTSGCVNLSSIGLIWSNGITCGTLSVYDAFTHPSYGGSATTSLLTLTGGLLSNASSTFTSTLFLSSLSQGNLYIGSSGLVQTQGTSTPTVTAPITYSGTLGQFLGGVSGAFACTNASAGVTGCLTGTDWSTFNAKQTAISTSFPLQLSAGTLSWIGFATTSQPSSSNLLVSNGTNGLYPVATSSVSSGTGISLSASAGALVGGSALTITNSGVISGSCSGGTTCSGTNPLSISSFSFPYTVQTGYNSTSTAIGFLNGLFSTASSTFSSNLFLSSLSQGGLFVGSNGLVKTVATSTATASTGLSYSGTMGSMFGGSSGNLTVNTSQNISTLSNLTNNGFVITSGGTGALSIDTSTYIATSRTLTVAGTANQITSSAGAQDLSANRTWTLSVPSQFNIQQASTTVLSANTAYFGGTATSSFSNAGVLTLASALTVANGGTGVGTLTGCLTGNGTGAITGSGTCNTSNASVSSVGLSDSNSTLTIGSTPVTTSGTITATLNLAHTNTWSVLQNFNYSSSTIYSSFAVASTTSLIAGTAKITSMTSGSVLFAGTGGLISQNNSAFFWDDANQVLGLGTGSPSAGNIIHAIKNTNGNNIFYFLNNNAGAGASTALYLDNGTNNTILYNLGTGYTTAGRFVQNGGVLDSVGPGGLSIAASNAAGAIRFYTNASTLALTLSSTQTATFASTVSATGFQISGAATAANYLRGNGTSFVSSAIGAADVPTLNQNTTGSAATLTTTRTLWGQNFNGSGNVTGSLTSVGDITGGASSMTITAGTGNSRTMTLDYTTSGGVATPGLTIDNAGNVGIGNATVSSNSTLSLGTAVNTIKVAVYDNGAGTLYGMGVNANTLTFCASCAYNGTPQLAINSNGDVGIGNNNATVKFEVTGRVYAHGSDGYLFTSDTANGLVQAGNGDLYIRASSGGNYLRMDSGIPVISTIGDGNLSLVGSVLTSSSDERLKDIQGAYTPGLDAIMGLKPILYKWNKLSGLEQVNTYAGFSAQNVLKYIPEAISTDSRGYYSLSDRPIEASLVNAVKELQGEIDELRTMQGLKPKYSAVPATATSTKVHKNVSAKDMTLEINKNKPK